MAKKDWQWCVVNFRRASYMYEFLNKHIRKFDNNTVSHSFDGEFYSLVYFGQHGLEL